MIFNTLYLKRWCLKDIKSAFDNIENFKTIPYQPIKRFTSVESIYKKFRQVFFFLIEFICTDSSTYSN